MLVLGRINESLLAMLADILDVVAPCALTAHIDHGLLKREIVEEF